MLRRTYLCSQPHWRTEVSGYSITHTHMQVVEKSSAGTDGRSVSGVFVRYADYAGLGSVSGERLVTDSYQLHGSFLFRYNSHVFVVMARNSTCVRAEA